MAIAQRDDAQDSRRRILDTALDLFASNGYHATSLRQIAEQLGVTKAALYYHFRTKDELLAAVTAPLLEQVGGVLGEPARGRVGRAEQRDLLRSYFDAIAGHPRVTALLLGDRPVTLLPPGRRFDEQREIIRRALGGGDGMPAMIRATAAVRLLELAVAEFPTVARDGLARVALDAAMGALESGDRRRVGR